MANRRPATVSRCKTHTKGRTVNSRERLYAGVDESEEAIAGPDHKLRQRAQRKGEQLNPETLEYVR